MFKTRNLRARQARAVSPVKQREAEDDGDAPDVLVRPAKRKPTLMRPALQTTNLFKRATSGLVGNQLPSKIHELNAESRSRYVASRSTSPEEPPPVVHKLAALRKPNKWADKWDSPPLEEHEEQYEEQQEEDHEEEEPEFEPLRLHSPPVVRMSASPPSPPADPSPPRYAMPDEPPTLPMRVHSPGPRRSRFDESDSSARSRRRRRSSSAERDESPAVKRKTSPISRSQPLPLRRPSSGISGSLFQSAASSSAFAAAPRFEKPPVYKGADGTKYVAFFTKKYVFSNHYVCPNGVTIDGITYPTTEHYYMTKKALFHGDMKVAKEVKAAPDARTAKKLVAALEDFDRKGWLQIQEGIMEKACLVKFHQNPTLRAELFATGDAVLVEASPSDRCWGVGLSMEDERIADPTQWRGGNLLGRIMMSVRDRLLVQYPQEARALWKKAPRYMP